MKSGVKKVVRPLAAVWRVLTLTLIICATSSAWAAVPTPVAVWDGDLANNSTKGKYTMSVDSGDSSVVSFADNKATLTSSTSVASKGVQISWPDPTTDAGSFTSKKMSVVIQYSGLSIPSGNTCLVGLPWNSTTSEYLVYSTSGNGKTCLATGVASADAGSQLGPSVEKAAPTKGKLLVTFSGDSSSHPGVDLYFSTYSDATSAYGAYERIGYWSDKKIDNGTFYGLKVGGTIASTGKYYRPGMTVEAVQIYDDVVAVDSTASLSESSTWADLVWDKEPIEGFPALLEVNVSDDATLNLNGATITAQAINFNIASGKTLTLEGTATIPNAGISVTGGGKLKLNTSNPGCAITVASGATMDITTVASVACAITNNGTLNVNGCTVSGAITNNGTVNTDGAVSLASASNVFNSGSLLDIKTGEASVNAAGSGLKGTITVQSKAAFVNAKSSDALNYGGTTVLNVYGEVKMGNTRWTIGGNNTINLYDGAKVSGNGENADNGAWDWYQANSKFHIYGDAEISARLRLRGVNVEFNVEEGKTLTLTGGDNQWAANNNGGSAIKTGAGTLKFYGTDVAKGISGSAGTIELSANKTYNKIKVAQDFSGKLKLVAPTTSDWWWGFTDLTGAQHLPGRPELELDMSTQNLFLTDMYNNGANPLTVKNLSGSATVTSSWGGSSAGNKIIDSLQTDNTTFSGIFTGDADDASALTVRGADNASTIYSLTLSGESDTRGPLTIENKAKVVFASSGKWSGGTVVVKNGGVLESQNSGVIAETLAVKKGAALKFATGDQSIQATNYNWSDVDDDLEDDERIKVDISEATPSNTPISIIPSGVTVDVSKFVISPALNIHTTPYSAALSVENGALKVTYSGNFCQDGSWLVGPTANGDAKVWLTQNSTLTTTTDLALGSVAFSNRSGADVTLTVDGTGELKFGGLNLPSKITIDVAGKLTITGTVSGAGTINVLDGGELTMDGATCSTKITVQEGGKLYTKGTTDLSNTYNSILDGGLLEVVAGSTTFATFEAGIIGDLTVAYGAEFTIGGAWSYNHVKHGGTSTLDIAGTVNMGDKQWQFGPDITINLRSGATINGNNAEPTWGDWGFIDNANTVHVFGDATIAASVFPYNTTFDVAQNATLTITGTILGSSASLLKSGLGDLDITGDTLAKPLTINGGKVVAAAVPTANVTINENGTFTLKNASWTGDADKFSGTGTLELLADTNAFSQYAAASTFSGKLKVIGNSSKIPYFNGTAPQYTNKPEFELSGYMTLTHQFAGEDKKFTVRNLTGATGSRIDPYFDNTVKNPRYVSTLQTNNTVFAGTFIGGDTAADRKTALYVYGENEAVHSLTLTAANTTYGPLVVDAYGKVSFATSGSWLNGPTTVKSGGVLESQRNAQVVGALTLEAGATLSFVDGCPLQFGSISWPEEGKVSVDVFGMTLDSSGTTLMTFEDEGTAESALSKLTCDHAILAVSESSVLAKPAAGSVTLLSGETTPYAQMNRVLGNAAMCAANGTLDYITIIASGPITIEKYADIMRVRNIGSADITIGSLGSAGEYLLDTTTVDGMTTYTLTKNPTTYIWTDKYTLWGNPNHEWLYPGNWGVAEVDAVRYPVSGDSIVVDRDVSSTIEADPSVSGEFNKIVIGSELTLCRHGSSGTVTIGATNGIVLTNSVATLTIDSNVDLDTDVITDVGGKVVAWTYGDNTITYYVADPVAEIGGVQYGSLANAFESASTTVTNTVMLLANCDETAVTLNGKTVAFDEGSYTFTGSFTGNGTLILTALLKSADPARWAAGWNGTVVMPENANVSGLNFDNYGIEGSTVRLTGATTATWLRFSNGNKNPVAPTIEIPEGASFTLAHTGLSSSFAYTFKAIKGAGAFSVNISGDIDLSDPGYSAYFLLKDVSDFTGSLSATGAGIAIGDTRIANTVAGGKIIVSAGKTATIASGKTWSAASGIEVNGTLNVAGAMTGGLTGGTGVVNLKGASIDLGKLTAATTQRYVAFSGVNTLTLECEYDNGSGVIFNGDTIANPFIKVESGATLNLSYGNFSGWNGNVCDGYIVNEGTLNISQKGSISTFFRNHLILTDGCTTTIGGTGNLSLYGGVATESTAQIQLISGTAEISSESAGIGFGNVSNQGGYGEKGVGITVGDNATLTISARIYASNVSSGSNPVAKYGNGTLILSNESNSNVEPWTLYAGTIKSKVALTVISGNDSLRGVSDSIVDGYHVYNLVSVSSPLEVTAKTFSFNLFTYGDLTVALGDGDTIVVPADCTGNQWNPSLSNAAGHPVIVRKPMNWKAGIGTMTIDTDVTVFAYGANGSVINDGAVISGEGALHLQNTVYVNGAASITCSVTGDGVFSLANKNATLTVRYELAEGKVTTSVEGARVIRESVAAGTRYRVVYGTIFSVY